MKTKIPVKVFLLTLIGIFLMSPIGCKSSNQSLSEFTRFTVSEGLASFSFEYSTTFLKPSVVTNYELGKISKTEVSTYTSPSSPGLELLIITIYSSVFFPHSSTMLERDLEGFQELNDFILLERSDIHVSGSQGELIAFTYSGYAYLMDNHLLTSIEPTDISDIGTSYDAYFDYGEFIWGVRLISDNEGAEFARAHILHVLETFEFLD